MQRLHKLRNRIAHHEPIHRRNLRDDYDAIVEIVSWIDTDCKRWLESNSRTMKIVNSKP